MRVSPPLITCGLILALLIGAAVFYRVKLPDIVEQRALVLLKSYGVNQLRYDTLRVSHSRLQLEGVNLGGQSAGWTYSASARAASVSYHWRELLLGKVKDVNLQGLRVRVAQAVPPGAQADSSSLAFTLPVPAELWGELPLQTLAVPDWHVEYTPWAGEAIDLRGQITIDDQLLAEARLELFGRTARLQMTTSKPDASPSLDLLVSDSDRTVLRAALVLTVSSGEDAAWDLNIDIGHDALLAWLPELENAGLSLDWLPEGLDAKGETTAQIKLAHARHLQLTDLSLDTLLSELDTSINSTHRLEAAQAPGLLESLSASLSVQATSSAGLLEGKLTLNNLLGAFSPDSLGIPAEVAEWLRWQESLTLSWPDAADIDLTLNADGYLTLASEAAGLALGNRESKFRISELAGQVDWPALASDAAPMAAEARINVTLRSARLPQLKLRALHNGPWNSGLASARLIDTAESMQLDISRDTPTTGGSQAIDLWLTTRDLAYASETVFKALADLNLLDIDLAVAGGSLTLESLVQLDSDGTPIGQQASIQLESVDGVYDEEYAFSGLSLGGAWEGLDVWRTLTPFEVVVESVNPGIDISDIRARVSMPRPTPLSAPYVNVEAFSIAMFGGRVYLPEPRPWDFAAQSNTVTLRADDWQLADMVALQTGQDIQAMGVLEGELPVTVAEGRIVIENGYLRALPPGGTIRYIADEATRALAASSSELQLAVDLLSEFEYEVLSSRVELDRQGNLLMGLSLAGRNPNQHSGKPVNFNINVEQNLDPLLQSLRLNDRLLQELENRLR
ncbi:MAG: YdbH domain-containing protein [Pseudomonadota bacterium]